MSHPDRRSRVAAALLLAYPASVLAGAAAGAVRHGPGEVWRDALPVAAVVALLAAALWTGADEVSSASFVVALVVGTAEAVGGAVLLLGAAGLGGAVWLPGSGVWIDLVLVAAMLIAGVCAWAAAALLWPRVLAAWRALALAAVVQCALMGLIAVFGVGGWSPQPLQRLLMTSQEPGVRVLEHLGWCCSYASDLVIGETVDPHWGGLTGIGVPVLSVANAGVLALLLLAAGAVRARRGAALRDT